MKWFHVEPKFATLLVTGDGDFVDEHKMVSESWVSGYSRLLARMQMTQAKVARKG
jgi:hypothetical protein